MNPRRKHVQPSSGPEKAFGKALRLVRKERDVSQEQLSRDADFDRTYISLLERGLRSPTIRSLVRLAEVLEVRPSEIIPRMEDMLPLWKRGSR